MMCCQRYVTNCGCAQSKSMLRGDEELRMLRLASALTRPRFETWTVLPVGLLLRQLCLLTFFFRRHSNSFLRHVEPISRKRGLGQKAAPKVRQFGGCMGRKRGTRMRKREGNRVSDDDGAAHNSTRRHCCVWIYRMSLFHHCSYWYVLVWFAWLVDGEQAWRELVKQH